MRRGRFLRHGAPACLLLALATSHAAEAVRLRALPAITLDDKGSGLKEPEAVAFGGKSLLVVADTGNGRLLRYTVERDRVTPGPEIRLPELPYPIQVQVDSKGEILALDGRLRRIARISPTGEFKGYLQPGGDAAHGPVVPRSFKIDRENNVYVLDLFQSRILILDPEGRVLRQVAFPRGEGFFSDLAVDDRGTVFALQSVGRRVFVGTKDAAVLTPLTDAMREEVAFPTAIAVDDRGRLYVADQNGGGIVILGLDGTFRGRQSGPGWKEGFLRYPSGLCVGNGGILFVADRENDRIQVFSVSE